MSMPYFSRQPQQQVAGHPHFVGGLLGALAEDLEFPLALRHFGVDAFVVDAGGEAEVEMLLDDLAGDRADVLIADAGVIRALRRRIAAVREAERTAVLVEEVFLLEAEPGAGIVEDGGALVGRVRGDAVRHHDFAHHQRAVGARAVRIDRDRLQHAIRAAAFRLHGRASRRNPTAGAVRASGKLSNSLICVLPRRFGVGVYPSSQIYSSLYFVIEISHELMMHLEGVEPAPAGATRLPGHHRPIVTKQ